MSSSGMRHIDARSTANHETQAQSPGSMMRLGETHARPHYMNLTANSSARRRDSSLSLVSETSFRRQPASRFTHRPAPPATDPVQSARLWKRVMSYAAATESSRGKRKPDLSSAGDTPLTGKAPSTSSTLPTSRGSSVQSGKLPSAKVTDVDFTETVLGPHNVSIDMEGSDKDLQKYFGIQKLQHDPKNRLETYKKTFDLHVWLEPDLDRIQREYQAMQVYGCNEAEYSAYALQEIFLNEPRYPWLPERQGDQTWLPMRMLQLTRKPPQGQWLTPQHFRPLEKKYEWDIRSDCIYYVSVQGFRSGFRQKVRNHTSVVQKRGFCHYLTIEFKKDEEADGTARHQIAVASAIALYNRHRLKQSAENNSKREWSEEDKNQMRHYGITFTGSTWNLWCTVPNVFETWTGCTMSRIYSGDCCIQEDIRTLISIINDIHYWGLAVSGKSCKADITMIIRSDDEAAGGDLSLLDDS